MKTNKKRLIINLTIFAWVIVTALLFVLPACNSGASDNPAIAALLVDDATPGETIFEANCIRCHPYGKRGRGPNLSKKELTVEEVSKQIRKGGFIMPSFSEEEINDEQLLQVAKFVSSLKQEIGDK